MSGAIVEARVPETGGADTLPRFDLALGLKSFADNSRAFLKTMQAAGYRVLALNAERQAIRYFAEPYLVPNDLTVL